MLWPTSSKHFQIHIHYSISSWAGTFETFANNQDVVCLVESWKKFHGIICHSYGKCTRGWWKITHSFFQTSLQLFSLLRIRKLIKVISYFALSLLALGPHIIFCCFLSCIFFKVIFWEISMPCVSSSSQWTNFVISIQKWLLSAHPDNFYRRLSKFSVELDSAIEIYPFH